MYKYLAATVFTSFGAPGSPRAKRQPAPESWRQWTTAARRCRSSTWPGQSPAPRPWRAALLASFPRSFVARGWGCRCQSPRWAGRLVAATPWPRQCCRRGCVVGRTGPVWCEFLPSWLCGCRFEKCGDVGCGGGDNFVTPNSDSPNTQVKSYFFFLNFSKTPNTSPKESSCSKSVFLTLIGALPHTAPTHSLAAEIPKCVDLKIWKSRKLKTKNQNRKSKISKISTISKIPNRRSPLHCQHWLNILGWIGTGFWQKKRADQLFSWWPWSVVADMVVFGNGFWVECTLWIFFSVNGRDFGGFCISMLFGFGDVVISIIANFRYVECLDLQNVMGTSCGKSEKCVWRKISQWIQWYQSCVPNVAQRDLFWNRRDASGQGTLPKSKSEDHGPTVAIAATGDAQVVPLHSACDFRANALFGFAIAWPDGVLQEHMLETHVPVRDLSAKFESEHSCACLVSLARSRIQPRHFHF